MVHFKNYFVEIRFRNVGERLYRGRQTREAAQFAAVIEAIKVAGSCGNECCNDLVSFK